MTTYYLDATNGDDTKSGTTEATAWQTIGKVNGFPFIGEDRIVMKGGETWTGTQLLVQSGCSYGAYGDGNKPTIDGNNSVSCFSGVGKSSVSVENIKTANGNWGFSFAQCDHIDLGKCDVDTMTKDGILFITANHDCTVSDCTVTNAAEAGLEVADGSHDIVIENLNSYTNLYGVDIHSHATTIMPYNITVRNGHLYNNTGHGVQLYKVDSTEDSNRNLVIQDSSIHDNLQRGILTHRVSPALYYPVGVTIFNCVVKDNGMEQIYIQQTDDALVHHNLIIDNRTNGTRYGLAFESCIGARAYNNTLINKQVTNVQGALYVLGARNENFNARNNIFWTESGIARSLAINANTGIDGMVIDYNLWRDTGISKNFYYLGTAYSYADWKAQSGQSSNDPLRGDPLFIDSQSDNYYLRADSPAVDAGIFIDGITEDYRGKAPDCGYYEYPKTIRLITRFHGIKPQKITAKQLVSYR